MDTLRILLEELTPSWLQRARHQGETRGLPARDAHQLALEADHAWAQCLTHGLMALTGLPPRRSWVADANCPGLAAL